MNKLLSGCYRIDEQIGVGGMSIVYKAKDERTGRTVAIKVLKDEFQNNADFVKRFRREAQAAARMSHDNIVKTYDVGDDGGLQYIVMEYVRGKTLKQLIADEGKFKPERAVKYAVKILGAIDHAHKKGIIHRDIKPQNILVDENDNIKVADFGIARLVDGTTGTLSDPDSVLGSVHYVSPEQANGDPVDEKTDLYSMGIVLYEMLTGTGPFDGETTVAIALKQVSELPRSMRTIDKSIPRSLDEVVMKALEKQPEMRYATAAEMARDLKRALHLPKGGVVDNSFYGRFAGYLLKNGLNTLLVVLSCITVLSVVIYGFVKVSDILYGVDIPGVVGMEAAVACEQVKDSDMAPQMNYVYSNIYSEDTVISQSPAAGERGRRNKTVTLTVSMGAEPVFLPDTSGMEKAGALNLLSEYGFPTVSIEYDSDSGYPADTVLKQTPDSGTARPGSHITLKINSVPVTVPSLSGKTLRQALDILEALNLSAEINYGYSTDDPADTVLLQNPPAGASVLRGTTVTIAVTLEMQVKYMADYSMRVPLTVNVRLVLTAPSGAQTEVFNDACEMDRIIALELESGEQGRHALDIYYDNVLTYTEELDFE